MHKIAQITNASLESHSLFQHHPGAWRAVAPHITTRHYLKESQVFHHADEARFLWLVLSGWVVLTRHTPDGKESITGLCSEGEVFGEAALFSHATYPYNAQTVGGDAELAAIPADIIRSLLHNNPLLSGDIMALLNKRISQTQLKLEHMSTLSAAQRLGCFFLRLCHMQADGTKTLQIPVEKHVLAAYLGMKPETLSRSQQQLKPIGISISGHRVTIENIEALRRYVCGSCSESGACGTENTK